MKNQKGYTILEVLVVVLVIGMAIGWVKNILKLSDCDFEPSYKAEVIRTVGIVVPFVGAVTGWMDLGK